MKYLWIVLFVEIAMTALLIYFIVESVRLRNRYTFRRFSTIVLLLSMMASMFNSMTYFLVAPTGFLNTVIAFNLGMASMTVVILALLFLATREKKPAPGVPMAFALSLLFVWNEGAMSTFLYALTSGIKGLSLNSFFSVFTYGINSYLFVVPMLVEMFFFLYLERPGGLFLVITGSILSMSAFNPLLLGPGWFVIYGLILTATAMLIFMILLIFLISRLQAKLSHAWTLVTEFVLAIFIAMSLGLFLGSIGKSDQIFWWAPYALASLFAMGLYFAMYISHSNEYAGKGEIKSNQKLVYLLVISTFISMMFVFSAIAEYMNVLTI